MFHTRITGALAALALLAPATALADSVVYTKQDGNIYLSTPDGKRTHQVTTTGGYSSPSQADNGTIAALSGERIHTMTPSGKLLSDIPTPVSDGPPPADPAKDYFNGPFSPMISPDGTRIAYTYYWQHYTWDPTCNFSQGCYRNRLDGGTAITYADRLTEWSEFGGPLTGWKWASWVDNDTIVRGDPGVVLAEAVVINRIAPGLGHNDMLRWMPHDWNRYETPTINRQRTRFAAAVWNYASLTMRLEVYRMAPLPTAPEFCFKIVPTGNPKQFGGPTFSPDGNSIAWQEQDGIHVAKLPDLPAEGGCSTPDPASGPAVIPDAGQQHWGPADVPAAAASGQQPAAGATPGGGTAKKSLAIVTTSLSRRAALRTGATVKVRVPEAGSVIVTAKLAGRVVARGTTRAAAAGEVRLRIRPTAAARRAAHATANKLTLVVTFTRPGKPAQTARAVLQLTKYPNKPNSK